MHHANLSCNTPGNLKSSYYTYNIKKSNLYSLLVHVAFHPRYSCQKFIKRFHFQRKYVFTFKYFKPYPNQPDFMCASF